MARGGVVGHVERRAEDGHDRVADVLVERAVVLEDHVRHPRQVVVQEQRHRGGAHLLRHAGEAHDVGEQDRDLLHLGHAQRRALRLGGGEDAARHLGREEAAQALALLLLGHDLLVEPRALHRHRRVVRERGQQVEIVQREAVRQHQRVHEDDPDHLVLVPERRAHGAADAVEADRVARAEARIDHGVGGQDRDAVLHDPVGDRLGDRDLALVRRLRLAVLDHHRHQLVVGLSSWSIRKPRSAGMWSKTMSITWCSTSSTGRTAISVSATFVSTFRMRLDFSISWTSAGGGLLRGGGGGAGGARVRRAASRARRRCG